MRLADIGGQLTVVAAENCPVAHVAGGEVQLARLREGRGCRPAATANPLPQAVERTLSGLEHVQLQAELPGDKLNGASFVDTWEAWVDGGERCQGVAKPPAVLGVRVRRDRGGFDTTAESDDVIPRED